MKLPWSKRATDEAGSPRERARRRWVAWRRDRERHVSGAIVSLLFHLGLLLLLATITFGPGSGLIGPGAAGLGEASIHISDAQRAEVDARQLLEEMQVEPRAVPERERAVRPLPRLASLGVAPSSVERLRGVTARFNATAGVGNLSGEFGSLIGRLRKTGLDVALVIDATGSMQHVIDELSARMAALAGNLQRLVPAARIGAVAYRDRGEEYTVRYSALTLKGEKIKQFLANLRAEGGGDWEDGVREGLESAVRDLGWRLESKKVIILVGSSPPHGEDMDAVRALAASFRTGGGIISTIDITERLHQEFHRFLHKSLHGSEPASYPPPPAFYAQVQAAFAEIARAGGGEMAAGDQQLAEQILVFAFGSRWREQVLAAGKGKT